MMVMYQFWCEKCYTPYEICMKLKDLDEYDKGKEDIPCPDCKEPLKKLICPPRTVKIY